MTKDAIENIIKRYPHIINAIREEVRYAVFYVGNRKHVIEITEEVKKVCEIMEIIYDREKDSVIKQIIKAILTGQSDVYMINELPYTKNSYYARKLEVVRKIYDCCISWHLVSFEEILNEVIAS